MIRGWKDFILKLPLLLLVLLPGACHLTNQAEEGTIGIVGDSSWTSHDRLLVVLEDGRGADTLFDGKLPDLDTLARLPAGGYSGGQALFIIQGFQDGELAYEEHRSYDGSRQKVILVDVPFDHRRRTASPDLDLRPDQVRLYLGGGPVALEAFAPSLPEGVALVWKTGNSAVATVSPDGKVSPVGLGATYVQAAYGDTLRDASAVRVVRDIPVVDAGAADTTVPAGSPVTFHVMVAQEYGDVAAFAWDLNGDGVFEDSTAGATGQVRFATPPRTFATGEVTVRFRVRDSEGNLGEAGKRVEITPSAPKIDLLGAEPLVAGIGDSVAFAAMATGGGAELHSFAWDFDGDGTAEETGSLQGESARVAGGHRYPQPATYRARLRIEDVNGVGVSAEVAMTVKLDRPVADAGADQSALPGAEVRLQGIGRDSLGQIVSREWQCGSSSSVPVEDSAFHVFTAPSTAGTTLCVFRVTDDDGLTAEDTLKVMVDEANSPAVASFTPGDTTITIRDSLTFAASATAGTADLKAWFLDVDGDGNAEIQGNLSEKAGEIGFGRRFPGAGRFDLTLKVEDQSGKTTTRTSRIVVLLDPPRADAGEDTIVVAGSRVNLRGTGSDSLGTVALREWKIGSGLYARVAGGDTSFNVPAIPGTLTCVFRVTDDDGLTAEDTMFVKISPSRIAELSGLTVSTGNLAPEFSPQTSEYSVGVPNATTSITVTPTAPAGATIQVNGGQVASGAASIPITLATDATVITIRVTAQDTSVKNTYTVNVNRARSGNADLSALTVSSGNLVPGFSSATVAYSVLVSNATTSFTVTPTAANPAATILVNGSPVNSGAASMAISLSAVATEITIQVTAQDTAVRKSYKVTVNRAPSINADLSNLGVSTGSLAPGFEAQTMAYAVSVPHSTTSMSVTPTAAHAGAAIRVNGNPTASGTASTPMNLGVGQTQITILVTAQDTAVKKTYRVTVTRAASPNADLSNLTVSTGALDPIFAPATLSYSVSVTAVTIRLTPTVAAAGATVTVDDVAVASGTASAAIELVVGANAIPVVVTAPDGVAAKTYTVNVTRISTDPSLSALSLPAGGSLNPTFTSTGTAYTVTATAAMTAFTVRPTAAAAGATITVDGAPVASGGTSGNLAFPIGSSSHAIVVTAPDGTTRRTYNLTVNRPVPQGMRFGYARVDAYQSNHEVTANVHNPGGAVDFVRNGVGSYTLHFRGLVAHGGAPGIVHATAYVDGSVPANCKVQNWTGSVDLTARISCLSMGGAAQDAKFTVLALFPRNGSAGHNAVVLADQPSATANVPYTPSATYTYSSGGPVAITRRQFGDYYVQLTGLGGLNGGTPMVTSVGTGSAWCSVDDFNGNGADMGVYVICKNGSNVATDAQFALTVMQEYSGTAEGVAVARVEGLSGTAEYAFNNGGGAITVAAAGTGQWRVTFAGLASRGGSRGGNVQVVPRYTGPVACETGGWTVSGTNLIATVKCFDQEGALADWMSSFLIWVLK